MDRERGEEADRGRREQKISQYGQGKRRGGRQRK
jgi:hypothetical protein